MTRSPNNTREPDIYTPGREPTMTDDFDGPERPSNGGNRWSSEWTNYEDRIRARERHEFVGTSSRS